MNVVVVNSDSVARSGVVVVEAVVRGQRVTSVHTVKVSGGGFATVSAATGSNSSVVSVGIISEDASPI